MKNLVLSTYILASLPGKEPWDYMDTGFSGRLLQYPGEQIMAKKAVGSPLKSLRWFWQLGVKAKASLVALQGGAPGVNDTLRREGLRTADLLLLRGLLGRNTVCGPSA
jgi:hypothetical protein